MKKLLLLSLLSLLTISALAQKPALDHSVYDGWKTAGRITIPNDGEWAYYTVSPQEGDIRLEIYNVKTGKTYTIPRASTATISMDGTKMVFKIAPFFQQKRQARIDKKKPDQMPKDTLGIIDLATGDITKYPDLKAFKTGDKMTDFVAFQITPPAPDKKKAKDTIATKEEAKKQGRKEDLYILNIKTMAIDTLSGVSSYSFAKEGDKLVFTTKPDKKDTLTQTGIFLYNPATKEQSALLTGDKKATFGSFYFNEDGTKIAFYANLDTAKDAKKNLDIYLSNGGKAEILVAKDDAGIPKGWKINEKGAISFRNNDSYALFSTCPVPREKDTTLVEFEQPQLDIWTWNEDYLPTEQKVRNKRGLPSYTAKIDLAAGAKMIQLADEELPRAFVGEDNTQDYLITSSDKPYRIQSQWDREAISDVYKVSLKDGSRELLWKGATFMTMQSSPDGAYYLTYKDKNWYLYTLATGELKDITSDLGVVFEDEDHDTPSTPRPYGFPVWSKDSKYFFIPDRFDLWQFDPTGKAAPFTVTEGVGRATDTRYTYISPYNEPGRVMMRASEVDMTKPMYFTTFNYTTKQTGFSMKDITKKKGKLTKLAEGPFTYNNLAISAGKKPTFIYTRGNFEMGNNLWITKDNFKNEIQLSDVNPQQREYNWGTVELVSWTTKDGIKAEGLLFKPENFDANKKYPVMIYFYEKYSQDLYAARVPSPSRSTVNIPFFVSNEYIVFIPDIYYKDGHPGQSAMNSIMPACDMLCEYPWVDGDNMAIQGQSWGGYQVAYMITQTGRFKAAGAGAPVSNMTSAYGGIRWESGVTRQFQYEQQQSRIGKNLWEGFDLYIENSPIFFVPNVTTPVLIMHNDADGAVPWWQGIEFFTSLRRCGKQAWMLQYNNEAHNLSERRNAKDLSIRLEQFFNHFLKGAPMPVWMKRGVPASLKGIDLGYEVE